MDNCFPVEYTCREVMAFPVAIYPAIEDFIVFIDAMPVDVSSALYENEIKTEHRLGPYHFFEGPREDAPSSFHDLDSNDNHLPAQSLDLREEFGIIVIMPSDFVRPGLNTTPYDAYNLDEEEDSIFTNFALNGNVLNGLASNAFAIELLDPEKFTANISDGLQFLEEIYGRLYGSNEEEQVL
ncbi:hypothetical protein TrVFT333_004830 [Trichoderma virens FT-333]|nr:hypothetical protein TrVFT333_004830 [Trichoderma virens FT-333]